MGECLYWFIYKEVVCSVFFSFEHNTCTCTYNVHVVNLNNKFVSVIYKPLIFFLWEWGVIPNVQY